MSYPIGGETVIVRNAPLAAGGRYGNQQRDWANATEQTVRDADVQPLTGTEDTIDREYAATHVRLYAPASADIHTESRIDWRGTTYEVDGEPDRWFDGAALDHIEATLKRLSG